MRCPSDVIYRRQHAVYFILTSVAVCHLLNDMMASLLPSIYPMFKTLLHLSFGQIGLLALTYQLTASLLQPVVGLYTDRHPKPFSLPIGLGSTLVGLLLLSVAHSFHAVVFAAALVGVGSSVFHPESSRVARMASGGRYGLAQSLFQVGGNVGHGRRAAHGCVCRFIEGTIQHRLVLAYRPVDDHPAHSGKLLVQGSPHAQNRVRPVHSRRVTRIAQKSQAIDRDPGGADFLQVLLPVEHQQLPYLLLDQQVPGLRTGRPDSSFPLSGLRRRGHVRWRARR